MKAFFLSANMSVSFSFPYLFYGDQFISSFIGPPVPNPQCPHGVSARFYIQCSTALYIHFSAGLYIQCTKGLYVLCSNLQYRRVYCHQPCLHFLRHTNHNNTIYYLL